MPASKTESVKIVATNRKAPQRFFILEALEAGISLLGHEVKALREGRITLEEGLVRLEGGQAWLFNVHIPPYKFLTDRAYEPTRRRRLLLHRREIARWSGQVQAKGLALVPLELYFRRGLAKVKVGLAKGKKAGDRREEIKKREADREIRGHR